MTKYAAKHILLDKMHYLCTVNERKSLTIDLTKLRAL